MHVSLNLYAYRLNSEVFTVSTSKFFGDKIFGSLLYHGIDPEVDTGGDKGPPPKIFKCAKIEIL